VIGEPGDIPVNTDSKQKSSVSDWWKRAVVYQVYPRSFCDSNGDGIGDLNGITSKLDYLKELGVDVIWISPIYQSPMRDNGYDISDYCAINLEFGTMEDFDRLLEMSHSLGLKIVMDLVVNHSSDEHPWFKESRSGIDSPKRDYYIWRKGNNNPPNDWKAWFGGGAWTFDEKTGEYYLSVFSPHQPDLNWENPALRTEIYGIMRFWLDRGIDGFRMDAISYISKPPDFPDGDARKILPNGPRVHEFLREMRREALCHYDIMTVGETGGVTVDDAVQYANAEGTELNMVFQFETVDLDGGETFKWNDRKIVLTELKETFSRWQNGLFGRAWNSLYWCNHDQPRIVSRFGTGDTLREKPAREKLAKMLAVCLHFMQGTPYIFQGEELGMTNAPFADIGDYRDLESINAYNTLVPDKIAKDEMLRYMRLKSRDNSRTPMHWNSEYNAGFSDAPENRLWIMLNPNYREINAHEQTQRNDSVFHFYKKLAGLRKTMDIITYGSYELLLPDNPDIFVYTRAYRNEELLVICNFANGEKTFLPPERFYGAQTVIANEDVKTGKELVLGAFGAAVLLRS